MAVPAEIALIGFNAAGDSVYRVGMVIVVTRRLVARRAAH